MNKVSDKLMAWLEQFDVVCGHCNEPMGCSDDKTMGDDYDAWTEDKLRVRGKLPGIYHRGCLAEAEAINTK